MQDKYKLYENNTFEYNYKYSWDKRNKNYLNKIYNRKDELEYLSTIIYTLIFVNKDNNVISETTYTPNSDKTIVFPSISDVGFKCWGFKNNGVETLITSLNYSALLEAVNSGLENVNIYPVYYPQVILGTSLLGNSIL